MEQQKQNIKPIFKISAVALTAIFAYLVYQDFQLTRTKNLLETELSATKQNFASTTQNLTINMEALKQLLATTHADKTNAEQDLLRQQDLLNTMNAQVSFMSESLGAYNKLAKIDREILEKYSRVYFLNENYTPAYLSVLPASDVYVSTVEKKISTDVLPFLQNLLDAATAEKVDLKIISAYRSFAEQSKLKSSYTVTYGTGANKFSADQGYSEHQLGTAVDFTTPKLGVNFSSFEKTASYTWLKGNAYKYGFILSYPKGNTYYVFEPWHWRFVGKALALQLHNENKEFYDIPQRDIDAYLGSIFNQ